MEFLILIILVFFLSYANGQMIFKKEYALVGNGVTDYKIAILWGILWTAIGFACLLWGLNDTPKIEVIIIYSSLSTNKWVFILITLSSRKYICHYINHYYKCDRNRQYQSPHCSYPIQRCKVRVNISQDICKCYNRLG